ncbi:endolytic transglycosylase MltG [Psychrobacter sp. HD31]|uniref:endolytic transglycosylase MltG n=1 Tax=Psychrobacter sp. HD31 TaxID=3112003 RepID=UPI003DA28374
MKHTKKPSNQTSIDSDRPNESTADSVVEKKEPQMTNNKQTSLPNKADSVHSVVKKFYFLQKYAKQFRFAVFAGLMYVGVLVYQTLFVGIEQNKQMFEVQEGQTYYGVMAHWQKQVPLFSNTLGKLFVNLKTKDTLHAGTYQLPKNPSFFRAMSILSQGSNAAVVKVQIIEGKTSKDLYKKLKATKGLKIEVLDNLEHIKSALGVTPTTPTGKFEQNLEGWFAPDTYFFSEGTSDKQILLKLYQHQQKNLDEAWQNRKKDLPYKTPYEALIMASIIEKETGLAEERQKIAGVFVNRLKIGMRLQTDPTIIYGLGERYDGDIKRADINEKTAYNTYQIDGLPPTPIALPSKAAIQAALNPADTKALYFVATGDGGHKFSNTLAAHNQAVKEYLKVMQNKNK